MLKTAENSGNYQAPAAGMLPTGSGVGSGGSGATTEPVGAYDDGGMIPEDGEEETADQGAGAATVDPMSLVKGALSFGRKSLGLPQAFFGNPQEEQGFDDGGEVEEDQGVIPGASQSSSSSQSSSQSTPDPHKTLQYLTGAGALAPEQAAALEQQVDPQGMMDGSERKLKALASAGSPQAQFGYLQSMRQKFMAFGAGARAAAQGGQGKPANLAEAAVAANQAFENLPSGHSIKFAPARGGMAMMARKHGGQRAMENGGEVEEGLSENIEDRRGENGEGWVGKGSGADPESAGSGAIADYANARAKERAASVGDEGVVRKKKVPGFDDGGEVEEEGVIPVEPGVTAAVTEPEPEVEAQPTILTPEQFDKLVQPETFEKASEKGWMDTLGEILAAVNPMGSAQAGPLDKGGTVITGRQQPPLPTPQAPASTAQLQPQGPAAPPNGVQQGGMEGEPTKDNSWEARQMAQRGDDNAAMQRYNAIANKLFPSVGQQDQRAAYIQNMMAKDHEQQGKMQIEDHKGRGQVEQLRQAGRQTLATQKQNSDLTRDREKQAAIDARAEAGRSAKTQQIQQAIQQKDRQSLMNFVRSEANSLRVANPKITPQQIIDHISKTFQVDPNIIAMQAKDALAPDTGAWPGQQPQPGAGGAQPAPRPQGANMDAAKDGDVKPYTDDKTGETRYYKFDARRGGWVPTSAPPEPTAQKVLNSRGFNALR